MPERATPSAFEIIARFVVVIVLIVLAISQWKLTRRVGDLEATLATHESMRSAEAKDRLRLEAERAEFRQRTYFPPGTFSKDPGRDRELAHAFSRPLRGMRADSLSSPSGVAAQYRLTWLAGGQPIALLIYPAGKGFYRVKKAELAGPVTDDPGQLVNPIDYSISPERADEFFDLMKKAKLNEMPAVNDGAEPTTPRSIFEWVDKDHKYHVVVRTDNGPEAYRKLCEYVLARADYERGGPPAKKKG